MSYRDFCGLVGGLVLILILALVLHGPLQPVPGAHVHRVVGHGDALVVRHVRCLHVFSELVLHVVGRGDALVVPHVRCLHFLPELGRSRAWRAPVRSGLRRDLRRDVLHRVVRARDPHVRVRLRPNPVAVFLIDAI